MSEKNKIVEITEKIQDIKKNVDGVGSGSNQEVMAILSDILNCLTDMSKELLLVKEETESSAENVNDLTERIGEIEEYLEENESMEDDDDDIIARVKCPYCQSLVDIGQEFLIEEDPKIFCPNCKNEVEVIISDCGCGCDSGDEGDSCGCGEHCSCDEEEGGCGCGGKH